VAWLVVGGKKFSVIGTSNATTYSEIFPLIQQDKLWKGATANASDMVFAVPKSSVIKESDRNKARRLGYPSDEERQYTRLGNSCWYTNIDHGRRHQPLQLMTMSENIKFSRHQEVRGKAYNSYENYDALEIPYTDAIPSDYEGVMGVPITFLDKYNPDQFEIIGTTESNAPDNPMRTRLYSSQECRDAYATRFGKPGTYDLNASGVVEGVKVFKRILIRRKRMGE
jgi:hypothetical protein